MARMMMTTTRKTVIQSFRMSTRSFNLINKLDRIVHNNHNNNKTGQS
jgi:hypothetical protein